MKKYNLFFKLTFNVFLLIINCIVVNADSFNENNEKEYALIKEDKIETWPSNIAWFDDKFPEPIIFRGAAKSWKIMELTYNYISENYPNSKFKFGVDIQEDEKFANCFPDSEESEIDGFFDEKPEGWPLSFQDFWNRVQKGDIKRFYGEIVLNKEDDIDYIPYPLTKYLAKIFENEKTMPAMFKDATKTTLFLSGPGSVRLTHSHESVILVQLEGKKIMTFSPPDQADALYVKHCRNGKDYKYNDKSCVSPVNVRNPDLGKFPKFENAQLYQIIIEPGDVIFIPEGWFHDVRALDDSISLSFFYKY